MNASSNLINRLSPSATLAMSQRSAELKAQGVDVINLSVGEPTSTLPTTLRKRLSRPSMTISLATPPYQDTLLYVRLSWTS